MFAALLLASYRDYRIPILDKSESVCSSYENVMLREKKEKEEA